MRRRETIDSAYFDRLYAENGDPWNFQTSAYEREKYARTLAALPRPHYDSALEIGCSIGVLTRMLADRCGALTAVDASALPLETARRICADRAHVTFAQMAIPAQWPAGRYDLMVFSEVLYYLAHDDLAACATRVRDGLAPGGDMVLVHYTGETDYPLSGDEAASAFGAAISPFAREMLSERHAGYRVDVWRRSARPV